MGGGKAPKPTAGEIELQRRQRSDLDELTRNRNESLKALKRNLGGRRGLLGSGSERGIAPSGGGRSGTSGGGLMSSGAASAAGTERASIPTTPSRASAY